MTNKPVEPGANALETIFNAALALEPSERAAFLIKTCADNHQLRQRVEALLLAHEAPKGFLPEQPTGAGLGLAELAAAAAGEKRTESPTALEQPGEKIGAYKLLQKIGEGGCGVVYMAEQEKPVRRRVALKVIKLGMDTRQVVARFEAERQALALMDHPNIARVFDAGATETGRPYFVMELVRGIKITDFCNEKNLPTRDRLGLFIQVCQAIQHAHQKSIIHRDVKPSNILVTVNDGVAVPKVIDFGIAKATNQQILTDKTLFTAFEQFLGTPAYMSPEQAEMTSLDIDSRTDIYSLGVLLYELLTGKTPFDTQELLAAGLDAMRRTIREREPQRPSTRLGTMLEVELITIAKQRQAEPLKLVQVVRGDLDWIVMKCLEKDRARRYETANGLARDIERLLHHEPVVARPPSAAYKLRKFIRRNRVMVASGAIIVGALVLGVVASSWQAVKARRAEREQHRLLTEAEKARQEATGNLWSSYLAQARARRLSSEGGRRFESLAVLAKAAAIRPSLELRNEAIACMTLADMRLIPGSEKSFKHGQEHVGIDPTLEFYALGDAAGNVSLRRVSDDGELLRLPSLGALGPPDFGFSPDGKFLCVRYGDGRVRVWNLANAAIVLEARQGVEVGFTPDCKSIVMIEFTNSTPVRSRVVFYDPASGQSKRTIPLGTFLSGYSPNCLRFDPQGRLFALSTEDGTDVLIVDAESGGTLKTLHHPDGVLRVAWHPQGRYLATACGDNLVYLWDTTTGEKLRTLQGHQNTPVSVAFNREGNLLVSSGWDLRTRLWDFPSGRQLVNLGEAGFITSFSPDDHKLAEGYWDGSGLQFFKVATGQGVRTIQETDKAMGDLGGTVVFSNEGRLLAYSTQEGIKLWNVQTGREIATLEGEDKHLIGFDARDEAVLVSSSRGLLRWPIKESSAGSIIASAPILASAKITDVGCVSANGKICGFEQGDGWQVYDTDTWTLRSQASYPRETSTGMAISPDGAFVAKGALRHPGVRVWDARTGRLVKELATEEGSSAAVAFSPDGLSLLTTSMHESRFWKVGTWSPGLRLATPAGIWPSRMVFSRDGMLLAGEYAGRDVRLYNAKTGEPLADLEPLGPWRLGLALNSNGTQLALCEGRDALRLWDLRFMRQELAKMGLDWNLPPYPPASTKPRADSNER